MLATVAVPPSAVDPAPPIVIASSASFAIGISSLSISATIVAAIASVINPSIWVELDTTPDGSEVVIPDKPEPSPVYDVALIVPLALILPTTSSFSSGKNVPIPTFPDEDIAKCLVAVEPSFIIFKTSVPPS